MHLKFSFLLILYFLSCSKPGTPDDLAINTQKWEKSNLTAYEFTLRINCFCRSERVGPHLVKVFDNKVISVNDQPYDESKQGKILTIDELIDFIKLSKSQSPYKYDIKYNEEYGFPTKVFFDFSEQMADEEIGYEITEFKKN